MRVCYLVLVLLLLEGRFAGVVPYVHSSVISVYFISPSVLYCSFRVGYPTRWFVCYFSLDWCIDTVWWVGYKLLHS
jgi:hypothetical protein